MAFPRFSQGPPRRVSQGVPKASQGVPKASQGVPKASPGVPKASPGIPKALQGSPKESPKAFPEASKAFLKILEKPRKKQYFSMISDRCEASTKKRFDEGFASKVLIFRGARKLPLACPSRCFSSSRFRSARTFRFGASFKSPLQDGSFKTNYSNTQP